MRTNRLIAALAVTALALSACSDDGGDTTTIQFGYIPDYNGISLLAIAEDQGLWEEQGLDAELQAFEDGPTQIQGLGSGDLDFGYIGPGAFWLPASGESQIVAINTLAFADRVIAQPGLTSMADLRGRSVGVPEGTSGEMVLNLALQEAGLTADDIERVPMDPATIVSAFTSGQIDAAGIWYPLIDSIRENVPDLEEVASTTEFPDSSFPTAFVGGDDVSDDVLEQTMRVLQEANDWRFENPEETIALAAAMGEVDEEDMAADAANVQTLPTAEIVAGTEDGTVDGWLNFLGEFFVGTGQLESVPDPSTYYAGDLYVAAAGA